MKKAIILCMCLLLSGAALAIAPGNSARSDDGFEAFWQKFKAAVIAGDKETVIGLSQFPIRMPGKVRNIKDAADLRLRYREVFSKYTSAAKCFAARDSDSVPVRQDNPKKVALFCGDGTGYWIVYDVDLTKAGWKFVRLERFMMKD